MTWKDGYSANSWWRNPNEKNRNPNIGFLNSDLLIFDSPERKIFLRNETERDHNHRGKHFRNRGEDMELLNEQFYENIVQRNADQHQQKITEQLYPAS